MTTPTETRSPSSYFVRRERLDAAGDPSGELFVTLADDAPDQLRDAVYEAHGDEMPNDWRYVNAWHIVQTLEEYPSDTDIDGVAHEIADGLVDVYTYSLLSWLADQPSRLELVDEVAAEYGIDEGVERMIAAAQYETLRQMVDVLAEAVQP